MKKQLFLILMFFISCKGNRDEDSIRVMRELKHFTIHYIDSVNKLSKQPRQ